MRVEPYAEGSIVHVIKRGSRGMDIVVDEDDRSQFLKYLFLFNDKHRSDNWRRETQNIPLFERPSEWPDQQPLTRVLAWTLMPNHFHLLLEETMEGGISKFMQSLCGSMSMCFNIKYQGKGSIFQGSYRAKVVDDDAYFKYLVFYIEIKNVLELYPGGLMAALDEFDEAWEWAKNYKYSSLASHLASIESPILNDDNGLIKDIYKETLTKHDVREILSEYLEKKDGWSDDRLQTLILE